MRAQGLFDPRAVSRLIDEHVGRVTDHSRALWTLLVLSVWMDEIVGAGRAPAVRAVGGAA